jgi:integrase
MASKFRYKNSKIWHLKWYVDGKEYRESTHTSDPRVASYLLAQKEQELAEKKKPVAMRELPFADTLQEYIAYSQARKTKKTVRTDTYYLNGYFKTRPIPRNLRDFNVKEFEETINKRVSCEEIEPLTGTGWIRAFKTFFSWCVDREYLERNPLSKVKNFRVPEHLPRYLLKEELKRLRKAAEGTTLNIFIEVAIQAGLRWEELVYLEWKDIDFAENCIWVINKPDFITKSKKPRPVPLANDLRNILLAVKKPKGKCFDTRGFRDKFDRIKDAAKLPDINLKALRHTFGAYCAMSGVPLPLLKEWMGHSSIKTTMIYAKLRPDSVSGAIKKVKFG